MMLLPAIYFLIPVQKSRLCLNETQLSSADTASARVTARVSDQIGQVGTVGLGNSPSALPLNARSGHVAS